MVALWQHENMCCSICIFTLKHLFMLIIVKHLPKGRFFMQVFKSLLTCFVRETRLTHHRPQSHGRLCDPHSFSGLKLILHRFPQITLTTWCTTRWRIFLSFVIASVLADKAKLTQKMSCVMRWVSLPVPSRCLFVGSLYFRLGAEPALRHVNFRLIALR